MKLCSPASSSFLVALLSASGMIHGSSAQTDDDIKFDLCAIDDYYAQMPANLTEWNRESVNFLIRESHRDQLAFTNQTLAGSGDVWAALIDMDVGNETDTVHLTYRDTDKAATPFGVNFWVKEHLFPVTRGVGVQGKDFTDIHSIRPADPLVDVVRGRKYFGMCNYLVRTETCEVPAEGAAPDTCACNRLLEPPDSMKGVIARALMYMDVRYDGTEPDTVDLQLTDCPFNPPTDMAYLSQMLTWHFQYPPDDAEKRRNQRACERWQGNRNPFIDHADLATIIFGEPKPLPEMGELIYPHCAEVPTQAPTFTANDCQDLAPGDIFPFIFNSEEPDNIGFFTFETIFPGTKLFLTDKAWTGEKFFEGNQDVDGTYMVSVLCVCVRITLH